MKIVPITFKKACEFVKENHRHNKPPVGHKFSIGLENDGELIGVAMAGRPVARHFDDGFTLEVNRTCTDGTKNANSKLYAAVWKAAKAMGYVRCITYTQKQECGSSLRAVGWIRVKELPPRQGWSCKSREREDHGADNIERVLWSIGQHINRE